MTGIAESIIGGISRICKAKPSVRLAASGGTAFYPVSDGLKAAFLDGGELREMKIKVKFKGEVPSELFGAAEEFCAADFSRIETDGGDDIEVENFKIIRTKPLERPAMESCSENGMSIVSFVIAAEYILEKEQL
ncbi:MAG: hypothetical protein ACI4SF_03060 [Oscillospiraceae bacterium]